MAPLITLRVYRGGQLLRSADFDRDIVKIGRAASAHLCVEDDGVARVHAMLEMGPEGRMSIVDMGSDAGTLVNGRRVAGKGPLRLGDRIGLGGLTIVVEAQ